MNFHMSQLEKSIISSIDGIIVINMDTRPDRYSRFMRRTGSYFPAEKIHRVSAVNGRSLPTFGCEPWFSDSTGKRAGFWGGTGGCALAHRQAIEYAKAQQWKNVLIFEDDAVMEPHPGMVGLIDAAMKRLTGPYLLYLGYNKPAPYGELYFAIDSLELWQTEGVIAAHAYIVSYELYDMLLDYMPTEDDVWEWLSMYRAIDVLYRDFVPYWPGVHVYVLNPIICVQDDEFSDIGQNKAEGIQMACRCAPQKMNLLRKLILPFRRLKIYLNSIRTHRRALNKGLPEFGRRKNKNAN